MLAGRDAAQAIARPTTEAERIRREQPRLVGVRGWLLLFCIVVTIIAPASFLLAALLKFSFFSVLDLALAGFYIFTGIHLWRVRPQALTYTKLLLLIQFCLGALLLLEHSAGPSVRALSGGAPDVNSAKMMLGAAVWFLYFRKSRRVKATYGRSI